MITIPQTIDLSKFKHKKGTPNGVPLKYRLVSMVFHHGPSAYSGHYTALGSTSGGSYYYFNDDQVSIGSVDISVCGNRRNSVDHQKTTLQRCRTCILEILIRITPCKFTNLQIFEVRNPLSL